MKKILLVALAAAAMVSCSQNEEIENAAQKAEINFQTAVSSTTRAVVTDLAELKKAGVGFTVQAYNTGNTAMADVTASSEMKAFMTDAQASFNNSVWELTGGPYYWPLTDKIQFFAYGNEGTGTLVYNSPTANYPSITYTVAGVEAQTDFVVAKVIDATKANATSGVSLQFTHALTQINFTIKCADALTYKLKSLEIVGVKNQGTYSFEDGWSGQSGTATYAHTITADGVTVPTGATGLVQDVAWMLMPQALPTTGASINIGYEIYDGDVLIFQENASTLDLKDTQAWEEGKKMRYTLTLSNKGAKISLIVPEVGTWNTGTDVEKNI